MTRKDIAVVLATLVLVVAGATKLDPSFCRSGQCGIIRGTRVKGATTPRDDKSGVLELPHVLVGS